jgi:hypothetical protein
MDTQPETTASSFVYNRIPTKVSRKDFNRYISSPYTFFLLNGDMELNRNRQIFV